MKHFSLINGMHSAYPETAERTIYVPPIIFDRNAHLVPRLVRVADLLWAGAGLSGIMRPRQSARRHPFTRSRCHLSILQAGGMQE
jgi:hypothetical protein